MMHRTMKVKNIVTLKLQKTVTQIMCVVGTGISCRQLLKDYKILTVTFLFVIEVVCFIKKHKFSLEQNVHVHDYNTKKNMDLNVLLCNMNPLKKM